ncbi:TonB family protein [Vibrio sp. PP-XX7]
MKHLLVILLALFGLAACSSSGSDTKFSAEYAAIHSYGVDIKRRVVNHLHFDKQDQELAAKVNFKLDQYSNVTQITIIKSSGDPQFDAAVKQAVRDSFPFKELLKMSKDEYRHFRDLNLSVVLR